MPFNKELYKKEMLEMIKRALKRINKTNTDFEIYTVSIWTDPNAGISAISFDSKENSDRVVKEANKWSKKHYDKLIKENKADEAEMYLPSEGRSSNPADFELSNFTECDNNAFDENWEQASNGKCWAELEPMLMQIGEAAFIEIQRMNLSPDFQLGVNGRNDWYEFTWNN